MSSDTTHKTFVISRSYSIFFASKINSPGCASLKELAR